MFLFFLQIYGIVTQSKVKVNKEVVDTLNDLP